MSHRAVVYAMASALLFAVSTPAAKALLGSIDPLVLAGLLYCGAGLGIAVLRCTIQLLNSSAPREAALERKNVLGSPERFLPGALSARFS